MKRRLAWPIALLLLLPSLVYAATITTGGSGNWSSADGVGPWTGTTKPVNNDVVEITAGHTVILDQDTATLGAAGIKNVTGSNTSVLSVASGSRVINGNVSHSGTAVAGFIQMATGTTLTINGQVTNSAAGYCIVTAGTAALTITNAGGTAVSASGGRGISGGATGAINITGKVSAVGGYPIWLTAAASAVNITGDMERTAGYGLLTVAATPIVWDGTFLGNNNDTTPHWYLANAGASLTWIGARTIAAGVSGSIRQDNGTVIYATAGDCLRLECNGVFVHTRVAGTQTFTAAGGTAFFRELSPTSYVAFRNAASTPNVLKWPYPRRD